MSLFDLHDTHCQLCYFLLNTNGTVGSSCLCLKKEIQTRCTPISHSPMYILPFHFSQWISVHKNSHCIQVSSPIYIPSVKWSSISWSDVMNFAFSRMRPRRVRVEVWPCMWKAPRATNRSKAAQQPWSHRDTLTLHACVDKNSWSISCMESFSDIAIVICLLFGSIQFLPAFKNLAFKNRVGSQQANYCSQFLPCS